MKVAFRTDASTLIGTGHVMRCLTLAEALRERGAQCVFVSGQHPGHLCDHIAQRGFPVHRLPAAAASSAPGICTVQAIDARETRAVLAGTDIDWLVVDHYRLAREWESSLRSEGCQLLVIDDLADRAHDCDLLLDQNLSSGLHLRYTALLPGHCRQLLGPGYALLRPQFRRAREQLAGRGHLAPPRRLLVFFGGTDPTNETAKALEGICLADLGDVAVDVVLGETSPHRREVAEQCRSQPGFQLHVQVADMASLMIGADIALGTGGSATWERCCLGLPTLAVILADNQVAIAEAVASAGALELLGWDRDVTPTHYVNALRNLSTARLAAMSAAASGICDGLGADRVACIMTGRENNSQQGSFPCPKES